MRVAHYIVLSLGALHLLGCATQRTVPTAGIAARSFVESALSMQGQPYRFGGATPGGFDCSGLVAYAAGRAGILVPRTAHEQLRAGIAVNVRRTGPGDLVFMQLKKELHVGILVSPGEFVHAPSSGGRVRIDRLDASPYKQGFFAARRIIP